ncbi:hypothetical protein [Streptomyces sp. URMC 125]|uniref:hypothetical protein n=1 Tax=Streptomyces sp. URMC 125 TaxID=3423419 RepID=UPI003F1CA31F
MNQQVRDVQKWLENPPFFSCERTSALTVTGGSVVAVPWDQSTSNGFTVTKNASGDIVSASPKYAGRYRLYAQLCGKLSAAGGHLNIYIRVNGNTEGMGVASYENTSFMDSAVCSTIVSLTPSDVITTHTYVSSGRTGYLTNTLEQQLASVFLGYWIGGAQ